MERLLHGEQYTEVKRPLSPSAKLTHKVRIKDIYDKGKNAVVITAVMTTDESGDEVAYNEFTSVIRGAGGFGGLYVCGWADQPLARGGAGGGDRRFAAHDTGGGGCAGQGADG